MEIIINRNSREESQSAKVTIDTSDCHYPYAIREAFEQALLLDGYTKEVINEVFNRGLPTTSCIEEDEKEGENKNRDNFKVSIRKDLLVRLYDFAYIQALKTNSTYELKEIDRCINEDL
jgi:hypothetical protein